MHVKQPLHLREYVGTFRSHSLIPIFSATITFALTVSTSQGSLQIPIVADTITLAGRESKVVLTDYSWGKSSKMLYSTAQVLYAGVIDNRDILVLHGGSSQSHEAALTFAGKQNSAHTNSLVQITTENDSVKAGTTIVSVLPGLQGLVTVWDSDTQLVLYADTATAGTFSSPVLSGIANDPFKNFWGLGTNSSVLVGGPYLVRDAVISGTQLRLRGDLKADVKLTVLAPRTIQSITWNGQPVALDAASSSAITSAGAFVGQLKLRAAATSLNIPKLTGWRFKDSLPERESSFDDSTWTVANKTKTNTPFKPYYGDGRVLYGCDYG